VVKGRVAVLVARQQDGPEVDMAIEIVIADAVRSAVGRGVKGTLALTRPDELAGQVIAALLARNPQVKASEVEDLVLGCAMPEGEQGLNVARVVGLLGGLPQESGALTINRFCSSGLQAIALAAGAISAGYNDVVVAGGVESMSMVPMTGNKLSASPEAMKLVSSVYTPMGITAENVARRFEISRAEQDAFALRSHQKAAAAQKAGAFDEEIVPVKAVRYEGNERVEVEFKRDELLRADTTLEGLAALKPAFSATGSVTAGNSSPLSDGAAAALVMSKAKADALGVKALGYFRGFAVAGVDPSIMGIGPVPAVEKLLGRHGLSIKDIDLFEFNEAFASQAVYVTRSLGIPEERLNVSGGAIALGHPLGCTGAKLAATALHELRRRKGRYAVVTMCIGGGQGAAGLFERA
jgi:acetyl-CoA acyltransferase